MLGRNGYVYVLDRATGEVAVAANSSAHQSIYELSDLGPRRADRTFVSYNQMKDKQFEMKGRPAANVRSPW